MLGTSKRFYYLGLLFSMSCVATPETVEITGSGYRRRPIAFGRRDAAGVRTNLNGVSFGPAGGDWMPAVGFGLYARLEGGDVLDTFPHRDGVLFISEHDVVTLGRGEVEVLDVGSDEEFLQETVVEIDGDALRLSAGVPRIHWRRAPDRAWASKKAYLCGLVIGRREFGGIERLVVLGDDGAVYAVESKYVSALSFESQEILKREIR